MKFDGKELPLFRAFDDDNGEVFIFATSVDDATQMALKLGFNKIDLESKEVECTSEARSLIVQSAERQRNQI